MAALNTIAKDEADTIRDGIAWLIVWKTGRSWHAESVHLNPDDDTFEPDDLEMVRKVLDQDLNAVMLNGYYCGHFAGDMSAAEIEGGIRWHYENGYNLLKDSAAFISEPMERPVDLQTGMPCYGKATAEDPDPYIYNGNMSAEDYELMHAHMAEAQVAEKPPGTLTLELTLTPGQAAAIVAAVKPVINKAINTIAQDLREFADWAAGVLRKVAAAAAKTASDLVDSLCYTANEHPKWWHLYKHAKKARTRKKYRRRLMQQLLRKLEAAAVT